MNALSCWHITYCMFWQNNVMNQFHSNEHKAIHVFAISVSNASILPKPSACFFGFGSKRGCEEDTANACLGGLVRAENSVTEACLARQSNSCWSLKSSWNKMLLSFYDGKFVALRVACQWEWRKYIEAGDFYKSMSRTTTSWVPMHVDGRSTRRTEVEFQEEIKIPQELRTCRCYYTLL